MKNYFFITLIAISSYCPAFAQTTFTAEDEQYFNTHLIRYERWLQAEGLDALFKIYNVDPDPDMVTLNLVSAWPDGGQTATAWEKLKAQYDATHSDSLESRLFTVFCTIMQVPPESAVVEFYNAVGYNRACFYRAIYFENGQLSINYSNCMNKKSPIAIDQFELRPEVIRRRASLRDAPSERLTRNGLTKEIRTYLKSHYNKKPKAKIRFLKRENTLLYAEVYDIQHEILGPAIDSDVSKLLQMLGLKEDWNQQERLTIIVNYEPKGGQHLLEIDLRGEYGHNFEQPRRNGYMDMEPEFEAEVAAYADKLAEDIRELLVRKD